MSGSMRPNPLPPGFGISIPDGQPAELAHLRRLFGGLTASAAALAALAFSGGPNGPGVSIIVLPIGVVLLLFWQLGARLLQSLGKALAEGERLEAALVTMHEKEEHFRSLASHDDLTGLPNQRLFYDRLSLAIEHSSREKSCLAVLYLDLDGFKAVNDSLGHGLGDRLLVELADRIHESIRASADDLVRSADAAMYRAKHRGRAPMLQAATRSCDDLPTEREGLWLQNS